jgi:hypothetical protein
VIEFDPVRHEYWEGGVKLPSVTQILHRVGLADTGSRRAANFGSAVHRATAEIDLGQKTLKDYEDDPRYRYLQAWIRFKEARYPEILEVEAIVGGLEVGCAGTLDRLVLLPWDTRSTIIDLKTGKRKLWHPLQLAGYNFASQQDYRRMCVYLNGSGMFHTEQFQEDERDRRIFKGSLERVQAGKA